MYEYGAHRLYPGLLELQSETWEVKDRSHTWTPTTWCGRSGSGALSKTTQAGASSWELPSGYHVIKHRTQEPGGTVPQLPKTYFRPKVSE